MQRRDFLRYSSLASTSWLIPQFLQNTALGALSSYAGKRLIVLQLSGGNDGLNTVIPYQDDLYHKARPGIGFKPEEVLKTSDYLGLHPIMTDLQALYDQGELTIINSVGYPNPDRSHFRSMDIWHTGSGSDEYWSYGWLGRFLDHQCHPCEAAHTAIEVDDSLSLALKGQERSGFAVRDPRKIKKIAETPFLQEAAQAGPSQENESLQFLYKTLVDTQSSATYLFEQTKTKKTESNYPATAFGQDLKRIAELIVADTNTQIYYAGLSGFDTHVFQKGKHERLLDQYSKGVKALVDDLKRNDLFKDTLILTFSEFGRRVEQNASAGTDHGAASNVFLLSGSLKNPGFLNGAPDLSNLHKGDLKHEIDFRRIYATILEDWFRVDAQTNLRHEYKTLPLLA